MKSKSAKGRRESQPVDPAPQDRVVVYVPRALHQQLKDKLAFQGTSVSGWFRRKATEEVAWNGQ